MLNDLSNDYRSEGIILRENFSNKEALLVKICEDYYLHDINMSEIAKTYDLTRYKVEKLLAEAKAKQLVSISIHSPYARNYEVESIFNNLFETKTFILKDSEDSAKQDFLFADFVANHTQEKIKQSKIVALSWGDSVYKVIDQFKMTMREELIFTQFIGEIGKYQSLAGSTRLVQKAAERYESNYFTIASPLYILNDTARKLMSNEPLLAKVLQTAAQADLLLSGVGTVSSIESVDSWNKYKHNLFPHLDQCVGFLYGRPFTLAGTFIGSNDDKTFGLSLDEILKIPARYGVCNHKFKAASCLGALNGNFFTDLFLDEKTAWKILTLISERISPVALLRSN